MGFPRLRRTFKLMPALRANSAAVAVRAFTQNLQGDRVRDTIGVPRTGLSYQDENGVASGEVGAIVLLLVVALAIAALFLG